MDNYKIQRAIIAICIICLGFWFLFQPRSAREEGDFSQNLSANYVQSSSQNLSLPPGLSTNSQTPFEDNSKDFIRFGKFNMDGKLDVNGANYVIVFNPQSDKLDFQVIPGLSHSIEEKLPDGTPKKEYKGASFFNIIRSKNAELKDSKFKNQKPFAAINADYIDEQGNPQGLNINRGISYSGSFAQTRSSFAISGGQPKNRIASIARGNRLNENLQFTTAGGNGRFYTNGVFTDICQALGQFACNQSTERSMAAITSNGWVVFLVHNSAKSSSLFTPNLFDDVLGSISNYYSLGTIQDTMLFDGGNSPAMLWNEEIVHSNFGEIGSIFAIYLN